MLGQMVNFSQWDSRKVAEAMGDELRELALNYRLLDDAVDVLDADLYIKVYEEVERVQAWLAALPANVRADVEDLIIHDHISLNNDRLYVNCSDTFYWGCSDCERIEFSELQALKECYALSPEFGGELWVARKRGMRPQTASYEECYPESQWSLFDAAGPERDDPDGKRRPTAERAAQHRERMATVRASVESKPVEIAASRERERE